MRLRDVKVGQTVKIKLSKTAIGLEVPKKFNGRLGIVLLPSQQKMVRVSIVGVGTDWFYPRELQLKKGKRNEST